MKEKIHHLSEVQADPQNLSRGLEVQLSGLGMQRKTYNHSRVCGQALQQREVKAGHKGDTTARVGEQGKHKISSLALGVLG